MKLKNYIQEVYNEMKNKVSWPSWAELQNSAIVVMIASLLFALVIFVMDFSFDKVMSAIYKLFY